MNDTPDDGLTPPGPAAPEAPEGDDRRTGGMSVDAWIETRRNEPAGPISPVAIPPRYIAARSRTMAGWALALSLLVCIPFGFLVAIGLAIAVLVRSADGGDHGRGRAIAALVISGLIVLANVAYFVVFVFTGFDDTERDADGRVVEGGIATIDRLRVGDCFSEANLDDLPEDGSEGEASATIEIVPCDEPHQAEAFSIFDLAGDDYPGQKAIDHRLAECIPTFGEYVGVAYRKSSLDVVFHFPSSSTWRFGDRTVVCSVVKPDLSDLTESVRRSKR